MKKNLCILFIFLHVFLKGQTPLPDSLNLEFEEVRLALDDGFLAAKDKPVFEIDSNGFFWFATNNGIYYFDGINTLNVTKYMQLLNPNQSVTTVTSCVKVDEYGNIWHSSMTGLYVFNLRDRSYEKIFLDSALFVENFRNQISRMIRYDQKIYACGMNGLYVVDCETHKVLEKHLTFGDISDNRKGELNRVEVCFPDISKDTLWIVTVHGMIYYDKIHKAYHKVVNPYGRGNDHWNFESVYEGDMIIMPDYRYAFSFYNFRKNTYERCLLVMPKGSSPLRYNVMKCLARINDSLLLFLNENFNFGTLNIASDHIKITEAISHRPHNFVIDSSGYVWAGARSKLFRSKIPVRKGGADNHYLSIHSIHSDNIPLAFPHLENYQKVILEESVQSVRINIGLTSVQTLDSFYFAYRTNGEKWQSIGQVPFIQLPYLNRVNYRIEIAAFQNGRILDRKQLIIHRNVPIYKRTTFVIVFITLGLCLIFGLYFLRLRKKQKIKALRLQYERKIAQLELVALKNQMSPHFVFNSINSIKGMIINDMAEAAADRLTKFSKFMRNILNYSGGEFINIAQEIEFLKQYIELENFRSKQSIHADFHISEEIEPYTTEILPFIVQPFVENCFVHAFRENTASPQIHIRFYREDGFLKIAVEDNGAGIPGTQEKEHQSKGIGLVENRLELHNATKQNILTHFRGKGRGTLVIIKIKIENAN